MTLRFAGVSVSVAEAPYTNAAVTVANGSDVLSNAEMPFAITRSVSTIAGVVYRDAEATETV